MYVLGFVLAIRLDSWVWQYWLMIVAVAVGCACCRVLCWTQGQKVAWCC